MAGENVSTADGDQQGPVRNYKSTLNELVMKVMGRPVSREDVVYSVVLADLVEGLPWYSATVSLNGMGGMQFTGKAQARRKAAEHAAAQEALQSLALSPSTMQSKIQSQAADFAAGRGINYKSQLQEYLAQALATGNSADIMYKTTMIGGEGYRSTVHVTAAGESVDFEGSICHDKKEAEHAAARVGLKHFVTRMSADASKVGGPAVPIAAAAAAAPGEQAQSTIPNNKSALNELIMKVISRPTTPQDIVYTVKNEGNLFQASVTIPAIQSEQSFEGEAKTRRKDSEQSAAGMALVHFRTAPLTLRLPAGASGSASTLLDGASSGAAQGVQATSPAATPGEMQAKGGNFKSALNELVMRILARPLIRSDIEYSTRLLRPGSFQATAKVPAIDENMPFEGAPRSRKRDAEQCAAQMALNYFTIKLKDDTDLGKKLRGAAAAPGGTSENGAASGNFKSMLNEYVMKAIARPLGPEDIAYTVVEDQAGFKATVKVKAIDDTIDFPGEANIRKKDSMQSAASAALKHFSTKNPIVAPTPAAKGAPGPQRAPGGPPRGPGGGPGGPGRGGMPPRGGKGSNQQSRGPRPGLGMPGSGPGGGPNMPGGGPGPGGPGGLGAPMSRFAYPQGGPGGPGVVRPLQGGPGGPGAVGPGPVANYKNALTELVLRVTQRPLRPNDITYGARSMMGGQFVATAKVDAIDPHREFNGEVRQKKSDAEQMAAKAALEYFQSNFQSAFGGGFAGGGMQPMPLRPVSHMGLPRQ